MQNENKLEINDRNIMNILIEMIKCVTPNYSKFTENKTEQIFIQSLQEMENSKKLHNVKTFPVKSKEEFLISLKCIINNKKLNLPARTIDCTHVECIEAKILFNYIYKFGYCPVCGSNSTKEQNNLGVDSIYIDEYLKKLLKESEILNSTQAEYILLNKNNMNWRPYSPWRIFEEKDYLLHKNICDDFLNFKIDEHLKELEDLNKFINDEENSVKISRMTDLLEGLYIKQN